jgi:RimJ/RimL family protein N-acetyltransferase
LFQFDAVAQSCALGITIGDKGYWGRGYGTDAIRLLLDYAFRLRNIRRIYLTVNSTNERAIGAYRRCGFVEEGRLRQHVWSAGQYIDLVNMGILRGEWETLHP